MKCPIQGNVGCIVDPELVAGEQPSYSYYDSPRGAPALHLPSSTPDTSFYQWVPFLLVLQVSSQT